MTGFPKLSDQAMTLPQGRGRFALELLGVGIFVSAYLHVAAGPALYGVATSESVGLFAPAQNRASIELTMSVASSASEASAETAVRLERAPEALLEAQAIEKARETPAADPFAAAPTELIREEPVSLQISVTPQTDRLTDMPAFVPPEAARPAPRPLDRRAVATAPRSADIASERSSPPRVATPDSPAQIDSAVRLGAESENLPELVLNQPPVYPADALQQGVEGTTIVAAKISRTGSVVGTSVAATSGSPVLDRAAEQAVRTWTFRPALRYGLAVEMEVGVPVVFSIQEARAAERDPAAQGERSVAPAGSSR